MVGITLSPEQILQAPPEVRRWIEQQVAGALGLSRPSPVVETPSVHLAACNLEQMRAVLSLINATLPVAAVFFELAHEPVAVTRQGLRVLRLDEMQRRCRLPGPHQVAACLDAIDGALRRVVGAPDVALSVLDEAGHCLVADETAHAILALWHELVDGHDPIRPVAPIAPLPEAAPAPMFRTPFAMSIPPASIGGPLPQGAAV